MVAADLTRRGCHVLIPFGEDCDYDLVADASGRFHRLQVKVTESDGHKITIRCSSHSLTNGKIRRTKRYTSKTIDWIVVYDATTDRCYYCPAEELGLGKRELTLRLTPARNGQLLGIREASEYVDPDLKSAGREGKDEKMEPAGLEPATSALQTPRSSS